LCEAPENFQLLLNIINLPLADDYKLILTTIIILNQGFCVQKLTFYGVNIATKRGFTQECEGNSVVLLPCTTQLGYEGSVIFRGGAFGALTVKFCV
jgi:hypothetical protein